jgi:phosphonate transport system ATP-binding protein
MPQSWAAVKEAVINGVLDGQRGLRLATAIEIGGLTKSFGTRRRRRAALDDVSLSVASGEMVALIGASGSGKSTLLRHVAGLISGDAGCASAVTVHGAAIQQGGRIAPDIRRRRREIGFVFQQFNLVGRLPVITNVLIGALGRVPPWRSAVRWFTTAERRRALTALARVGIGDLAWQRASTLSGGQQRAAIARALVQEARVILADEPIASLDPESSRRVMETLARINREDGTTVMVSLHQVDVARRYCPRVVALRDGRVVFDGPSAALTPDLLRDLYGTEPAGLVDMDRDEASSAAHQHGRRLRPGFAAAASA